MKLITVHTSKYLDALKRKTALERDTVIILAKSWYDRLQFWVGVAMATAGILTNIQQYDPTLSKAGLIAGVLLALATFFQTEVAPSSIVTDPSE